MIARTLRLGFVTVLLVASVACQGQDTDSPRRGRAQALTDSIERGYEHLQQMRRKLGDSLSPPMQHMYGAMHQMHGQTMRMHRQGMGGQGMRGRGMMGGQNRGRHMHQGPNGSLREWHQQMMSMHASMAQMHGQGGRGNLAARHREMERLHRRMMQQSRRQGSSTSDSDAPPAGEEAALNGRDLYAQHCASCHGPNGQGVSGAFPPLAGASWATGDPENVVRILLHGLQGPIEVQGSTYSGVMPAFGQRLNDAEIAALLTYVRSSWGNDADAIGTKTVRAVRTQHPERSEPWSVEALDEEAR